MSEALKNNFETPQESGSKWDELTNLPKPDNYEAKPLTTEQIDEIRKQDAEKRKEWVFNNQHDIVRKRSELAELKTAQERGDEIITFERRTKIDGQARDAEGKPYIRRDTEFVNDFTISRREQELGEAMKAQDIDVEIDAPKPPEK